MAEIRTLAHPPIVEALLDVQFAVSKQISDDALEAFVSSRVPAGWNKQRIGSFQATFGRADLDGELEVAKTTNTFEGFMVRDEALSRVLQYRRNRLTVSHTGAYKSWENLQAETEVSG